MDNDSTRNGGPLSLPERAKRNLLSAEQALFVDDIAWLEHPADPVARAALAKALRAAVEFGDLPDTDFELLPLGIRVSGL